MQDISTYKHRLTDYLIYKNIHSKNGFYHCPNPMHSDEKPSVKLYNNESGQHLHCMSVCNSTWDIFDIAGFMIGSDDFKEQLSEVERTLGIINTDTNLPKQTKVKQESAPVSIPIEKIDEVYNDEKILAYAKEKEYGDTITGKYICYSPDWQYVHGCEYRFEYSSASGVNKCVFLIWYNGKTIKWTNPPRLIFGLNEIKPVCPYLIVEGPKTREIASKHLPDFNVLTWNGGANNADKVDWCSVIPDDAEVYLWPDDDEPGISAMKKIEGLIVKCHTVPIIPELRKIKPKGADIVEAISYFHDYNLLKTHILASGLFTPIHDQQSDSLDDFFHRRCLGVADDRTAYFIDASGRLENIRLKSLNKNVLMTYCPLSFWEQYYSLETKHGYRIQWDEAISDVIQRSQSKDFDPDTTLGRGAWRNKDGSICYHDGIDTTGPRDSNKHYLRKQKKDIGINDNPADVEICQEIGRIALSMTFETKLDAVRCLAWSCLAPFAGALPWRPAILLTGSSETGKTTIINSLIRTIGIPEFYNGAETTSAGLRSDLASDACGVVFDETEGKEKAQKNREELFLVMRQSTSDDAPKVVKSNKDQATVKYNMNNMFLFSSIHAGIDDEADEKRILRVNLKKTKEHEKDWNVLRGRIAKYITEENCRAIRATTWNKLSDIIKCAYIISDKVAEVTNLSSRSAFAESLILSCYFLVWRGMDASNCTPEIVEPLIGEIYLHHEVEDRNEPKENVDKILDTIVYIPEKHENKTLREMLEIMGDNTVFDSEKKDYKLTLERYGLKRMENSELAIQKDNGMIKKILDTGNGYNKILWRHKDCVNKGKQVRLAGTLRTCVMIKGLFDENE